MQTLDSQCPVVNVYVMRAAGSDDSWISMSGIRPIRNWARSNITHWLQHLTEQRTVFDKDAAHAVAPAEWPDQTLAGMAHQIRTLTYHNHSIDCFCSACLESV